LGEGVTTFEIIVEVAVIVFLGYLIAWILRQS
jgi:hypothetical protein